MISETINIRSQNYIEFLNDLKKRIFTAQIRSALAANSELIGLYWHIGESIVLLQQDETWGKAVVECLSSDLKIEYPGITGFSRSNLYAMRQMVVFFKPLSQFVPQAVGQLPWGHTRVVIAKIKNISTALFYLKSAFENGWSRDILESQIELGFHDRVGESITNFNHTIPQPLSDLAQQTLKDPYIFDFLTLGKTAQEKDIERQLIENISRFLLELGKGFAFIGKQYHIQVNNKDYYLDLLFYHLNLQCYIVIELKAGEFNPEFTGKMNFYLSAVDDKLKRIQDNPSIGIILCKFRDKVEVEYALRDINKPIGVSTFRYNEIPLNIQSQLPTVEQLEREFTGLAGL